MSATENPLKLRSQPAETGAKTMPAVAVAELPVAEAETVSGSAAPPEPPPLPSAPSPDAPPPGAAPSVPERLQPPVAAGPRPPARDLGLFGRLVVWSLLLALVGGTTAGWFLGVDAAGSLVAGLDGEAGTGPGFETGVMPEDMMEEFAAAMEQAMSGLTALAPAPPEPAEAERGDVTLTATDTEVRVPSAHPELQEVAVPDLEWPDMQLNGVLIGSEDWKGSVILDAEMVPLNDTHNGVKVIAVETYGAWFEYRGARKYVLVNERTG